MVIGAIVVAALLISKYANNDLGFSTARAYAGHGNLVSLYVDGQKRIVSTNATTVGDVLSQFEVSLQKGDVVEPSVGTVIDTQNFNVNVYRAVPVLIDDNGHVIRTFSGYQSPRQIAAAAGLTVYPEDKLSLTKITDFTQDDLIGNKVTITRAKPIQVILSGKTYNFRSQASTVGQMLAERKIQVDPSDLMSVKLADPLTPGLRIVINKISQDIQVVNWPITAATQVSFDDTMPTGTQKTTQTGSDGVMQLTYLVNYKDKVETARNLLDSKVVRPMIATVIVRGRGVPNDVWARLRQCESGGDYGRNSGNGYFGAYQFQLSTWTANGGTGRPDQAPPALQDAVARTTQARRGWGPWPVCSVKLGLR